MTSAEIRQKFLDFFRSKAHDIVASAPIVVKNDPTLMFTNAGMNQFKDYFLGNKVPPSKRVADTQKCLRVSGKHNDLEEVGVDTYHHTMFEMLGIWSFGDYFKTEAIAWSWELLTDIYNIPKDRLYVTIFEGDSKEGLPKDDEALTEWKKWIAEDRILLGNKKDNFWEMGDTGPCGPCTEIHVDTRPDAERKGKDGKELVNNDHPQVIEIWNNVFIQFNRLKDGKLEQLPAKHVDTGMGLERLVRVLQQKQSNYDTDVFTGTIAATEKIAGKKYEGSDSKSDISFRVIADHIRAISFTIADGQLPSNTGAGYVIRRILRRAVRYYYSYLEYKQPLLHELVPVLAEQFKNVFPELHKQVDFVKRVVKEEEETFLRTLGKGIERLNNYLQGHASNIVEGKFAFELYDTYGFPLDLTRLIISDLGKGWTVDEPAFETEMQQQKARSRAATSLDTEDWVILKEDASSRFIGYDHLETETSVSRYRKVKAKGKEAFQLVLETTPFYAESGGQVGDMGTLDFGGQQVKVIDTKKENDLIIHVTEKLPGDVSTSVLAVVDSNRRGKIAIHHSATHLLHAALRTVLGTHVAQKGSLVNDEYLRFDFSHFAKVSDDDMIAIESMVNEKIRENIPVVIKQMPKEEALATGAMALFGEKYSDIVRVVIIDPNYSIELCGGTHVGSTGELGYFKLMHESAIAAGVRRIEAVSGGAAEQYVNDELTVIKNIREVLKHPKEPIKSIENIIAENNELKKKLEKLEAKQLSVLRAELVKSATALNGASFLGAIVEVNSADALKRLCYELKSELKNYLVVLAANVDGKPQVAVMVDESLSTEKNLEAPKIIKEYIAPLIKGGGGGQKTLATAGGQDASNLPQVIEKVKSLLQ